MAQLETHLTTRSARTNLRTNSALERVLICCMSFVATGCEQSYLNVALEENHP